jgi:hypothetical protein
MKFTAGSIRGGQVYLTVVRAELTAKILAANYNSITDNGTWYSVVTYRPSLRYWVASIEFWETVVETPVQNSLVLA